MIACEVQQDSYKLYCHWLAALQKLMTTDFRQQMNLISFRSPQCSMTGVSNLWLGDQPSTRPSMALWRKAYVLEV